MHRYINYLQHIYTRTRRLLTFRNYRLWVNLVFIKENFLPLRVRPKDAPYIAPVKPVMVSINIKKTEISKPPELIKSEVGDIDPEDLKSLPIAEYVQCPACPKVLKNRPAFREHVHASHAEDKDTLLSMVCKSCNIRFKNFKEFMTHKASHGKDSPTN